MSVKVERRNALKLVYCREIKLKYFKKNWRKMTYLIPETLIRSLFVWIFFKLVSLPSGFISKWKSSKFNGKFRKSYMTTQILSTGCHFEFKMPHYHFLWGNDSISHIIIFCLILVSQYQRLRDRLIFLNVVVGT